MLSVLWSLFFFICALVILIFVHEFGHFFVARLFGVKVEKFSIGFGKVLWRHVDKNGTEYVLSLIPLGGFIKMLDDRVDSTLCTTKSTQSFNNKSIWQRMGIVSAGPIFNFIFAIFAYLMVFIIGIPVVRPVIDDIIDGSPAAEAKISSGMEIKSINGIETPDWDSVYVALSKKTCNQDIKMTCAPLNSTKINQKNIHLHEEKCHLDARDLLLFLGIKPNLPWEKLVLGNVQKNSAGNKAGLQPGDKIITASDRILKDWRDFDMIVRNNLGIPILLEVEREGKKIKRVLTPDNYLNNHQGCSGLSPRVIFLPNEYTILRKYGIFDSFCKATVQTWKIISLTTNMIKKMMIGEMTLQNISGPISIAKGAGKSAEYGLSSYVIFLAIISINLGMMNLFPLPVLDGGHLFFLLVEKIFGKPLPEVMYQIGYGVSVIILMFLTGLAFFNDFSHF
ncbi:sigma E protease regulator RseP [Candidatus Erwinia haradaeae]|uniref:Zinc metalloprotease n=1 Tax=Candidatus Erwinia haradaeae TaxID=1922217 RepID=A0A451D1Z0_9GAMM|nr:sigma E protease regulator RseP [Candidatus Erwinia haradaeae]VFP79642.1 Regulator of sigma-E protease RseP [Candidatus Erwinia haradaeae]